MIHVGFGFEKEKERGEFVYFLRRRRRLGRNGSGP